MAKPQVRPASDVSSFLQTHGLRELSCAIQEEWSTRRTDTSLLQSVLNRDSDLGFLDDAEEAARQCLADEDLPRRFAESIVDEVLAAPSFTVTKQEDTLKIIRQAVLIERDEERSLPFEVRVWVDLWIRVRHVPRGGNRTVASRVERLEVNLDLCELTDDSDLVRLVREYLEWLDEFPTPARPTHSRTESVLFLGDARCLGDPETPADWRDVLKRLARAFNVTAEFQQDPKFNGSVGGNVRQMVRFEPYRGAPPESVSGPVPQCTDISVQEFSFSQIIDQVIITLMNWEEEVEVTTSGPRKLEPGEKVFHRKIGNNRHYDNFDAGMAEPCKHGVTSFIPFDGPKSRKGMARRYFNFEPAWLYHCKKYPNCNVYAVFASSKGSDPDS